MRDEAAVKKIVESLRKIGIKQKELYELTGFELYGYLVELEVIHEVILDKLEVPPWDADEEIVLEYLWGRADYSYEEMLEKVDEAKRRFDRTAFENYVKEYEEVYGTYHGRGDFDD